MPGSFWESLAAAQLLDVVDDDLHSQHSITLVVKFKGELAKVQLEHPQIVHRLINDLLQSPASDPILVGTLFATENGFESRHV